MSPDPTVAVTGAVLPPPIVVRPQQEDLDELLGKEWLIANELGAYASSTAVGCNVRRYHGLLVAAALPPGGRIVALSTVMEQLTVGETDYYLATNEFADVFSPLGVTHLAEFRNDVCPTFVFRAGGVELIKEILLAEQANAVAVRYRLSGQTATLRLWPFTALRDFHQLRKVHQANQMDFGEADRGAVVHDRLQSDHAVHLISHEGRFCPKPQWWYNFQYRLDLSRGQDGFEDLYTPGCFACELSPGQSVQLTASMDECPLVDFEEGVSRRRARLARLAGSAGASADETARHLAVATDAFVVQRTRPLPRPSATILAGYHWFADWGRDAFVALPGLLLCTGRFKQAREVFRTFAHGIRDGMVPNRFDEYDPTAHYNSIDASLWFIVAAERYAAATGDMDFWARTLQPACNTILTAYREGTRFGIHQDADSLLTGGSPQTQLTWMDAALGEEVITPRHGKAVEVNALWHSAHRILADRCRQSDPALADQAAEQAHRIAGAFAQTFWNDQAGCLYDCVNDDGPDASIRPNQLLAVSLPHSPLSAPRQGSIVRVVSEKLLTPVGLRTLSPEDPRYRSRYGGSWESRDRAYHQGTVWAWLIGPFVEAYLKTADDKELALARARQMLSGFDDHLRRAGLGFVSEIFDAEAPHRPRGCVAQAWSVGEVLRAKQLVEAASRDR